MIIIIMLRILGMVNEVYDLVFQVYMSLNVYDLVIFFFFFIVGIRRFIDLMIGLAVFIDRGGK